MDARLNVDLAMGPGEERRPTRAIALAGEVGAEDRRERGGVDGRFPEVKSSVDTAYGLEYGCE